MSSKYKGELVLAALTATLRQDIPAVFDYGLDRFAPFDSDNPVLAELWENGKFIDRDFAEVDPNYKQLVPYALILQQGKVLVYTRGKPGAERRLHAKRSIGVGGHINPKDVTGVEPGRHGFQVALVRELIEELGILEGDINAARFIGLVNEDSAEVGRVHLGLVYVVDISGAAQFNFENCLLDAEFLSFDELAEESVHASLEGWSQLVAAGLGDLCLIPS